MNITAKNISFSATKNIFHVDDERPYRNLVKSVVNQEIKPLAAQYGDEINLVQTATLPEALNALKGNKFDAIISDGRFPNAGDYQQVYRETVENSGHPKDCFVLLSGDKDTGEEIERKGSIFVLKDFDWTKNLSEKLKSILYKRK